ncbi:phosphoglycerate mutase 2 [Yamadazyma tenuis]|uniref:Phosphoglycerate mutase n=1 Tax=Candida tenuis (strain ATCC 10573 / BCRC 21748 / CBS 615 / JCM 9827 / NBRC 10315 / NRRL Y-1498 / VKM Y-70) TaxID=590646 RepID=G3B4C9_CANTC|nr:phosphoglycerate mutase-like protein [Yamadazyma tenuis ATCC 10573]EGV63953.1 phosphoglycerate mutase-like protein [Yamadazyma tenuis ATCC 10573]WEJ96431.1 phosphoglycerate mutase 2 [Yamadazyma tenuis]
MMKLVVLRHGESLSNDENKFSGWIDVKLSDKGKREAEHAGELIAAAGSTNIRHLYTSRLSRSIQTGNIILETLDLLYIDHHKCWELNERHYGAFQGHNRKEIFEQVGAQSYNYIRRNFHGKPPPIEGVDGSVDSRYDDLDRTAIPNGESLEDVMNRFIPLFKSILSSNAPGDDILIITHGSVVRSIIKYLANIAEEDISKVEIPTGIPIIFELDDQGRLQTPYHYLNHELALQEIQNYRKKTMYKM